MFELGERTCLKRQSQSCHFRHAATEAPDVTDAVIRSSLPNLRSEIAGTTNLGSGHVILNNLGDVQVTDLNGTEISSKEEIARLDVSVNNMMPIQVDQAFENLDKISPDVILRKPLPAFPPTIQKTTQIPTAHVLNNHPQASLTGVQKSLMVIDNEFRVKRAKYPYFIQCILNVQFVHFVDVNELDRDLMAVGLPAGKVDFAIGALADLLLQVVVLFAGNAGVGLHCIVHLLIDSRDMIPFGSGFEIYG
jgi:hypothetical protein